MQNQTYHFSIELAYCILNTAFSGPPCVHCKESRNQRFFHCFAKMSKFSLIVLTFLITFFLHFAMRHLNDRVKPLIDLRGTIPLREGLKTKIST